MWNSLPADLRLVDNYARFRRLDICLAEAAAPSDLLFSGAVYKYTYLLTYLLTITTHGLMALGREMSTPPKLQ